MILIVGGAHQGKRAFAVRLSGLDEPAFAAQEADGERDEVQEALRRPYVHAFHGFLRRMLANGAGEDELERYTRQAAAKPGIIMIDEVGCGVVPMARGERDYRECAGRMGQLLAAEADEVWRVVCGIPQRIK